MEALARRTLFPATFAALAIACAMLTGRLQAAGPHHTPLAVSGLTSGTAILNQKDRVTFLDLKLPGVPAASVPLTHKGKYPQWTDGPYRAHLIADVPGSFLIFTDTLASNPTNIQGPCGASPTGERYLHVISLSASPRETYSVLVQSCWLDLTPSPLIPVFDKASSTLTIHLVSDDGDTTKRIRIAQDGTTTPVP